MKSRSGSLRNLWLWPVLLVLIGVMCNLPVTPQGPPGVLPESAATMTALFGPLPTVLATYRAATATPVQPRVLTPTPVLPTPPGPLREGGTVAAVRVVRPPLVDAQLGEWERLPYRAQRVVYGEDRWDGPEDVSARFAVAWDENALYLAVQVTDDVFAHPQAATGFNLFRGDALEVLLDRDLYGDFTSQVLNQDDYHLGISPGIGSPGVNAEAYRWFPQAQRGALPEVVVSARATGQAGGYVMEIAIPWDVLGGPPEAGSYYGFALRVSDNDLPDQPAQQSMVANVAPPHVYNNPLTWGNLVLLP